MAFSDTAHVVGTAPRSLRITTEAIRGALLWLMAFAGAFVFIEPSPYEVVGLLVMLFFVATGLTLSRAHAPLMVLLILYVLGFMLAVIQVIDQPRPVTWVAVSMFLALTAVFFSAMLTTNTQARLDALMRGYVAAAMIASLVGLAAYFHLFGSRSETFLLYSRARGTFNDPNVLGAFLVLPGLIALQRILAGRLSAAISSGFVLLVLLAALFLSFSRAAWGQFGFSAFALMAMTFITSRSASERGRIVLLAAIGALVIAVAVTALLSIGQVADLFKERATLDQSHDFGHFGRFGRYILGADLALDRPFGLGPLQFSHHFPEDPHNTYLNTFMSGGWLTGFTYLTLTLVTVVMGARFVFVATPWRPTYLAVYAAYLGVAGESAIIDTDHWRHYFLVLGVLWGLIVASRAFAHGIAIRPAQSQGLV